jgi:tetratricopeptide (TPR) repeat protein
MDTQGDRAGAPDLLRAALRRQAVGDFSGAVALLRQVPRRSPDHPQSLNVLGVCLAQQGRREEAAAVLEAAIALSRGPAAGFALANLGNVLQSAGRLTEALGAFDRALLVHPDHADIHANRASALRKLGRMSEAIDAYTRALLADPGLVRALVGRGATRCDAGEVASALQDLNAAVQLAPLDAVAHYNRGVVLRRMERVEESVRAFEQALRLRPGYAEAHYNLGLAYKALGQRQPALAHMDAALAHGADGAIWASRGHLLQDLQDHAAALASYDRSLALREDAGVRLARADALRNLGRYAEAAAAYEDALRRAPDDPDAAKGHFSLAACLLLLGDFARGWPELEWRWADPDVNPPHRYPLERLWLGKEDPSGRTVLLHSEWGLGDVLQFCRYAPLLAQRGARVVLEVPQSLSRLMQSLDGVERCLACAATVPAYDMHVPIMSLPLAFGTREHDIPAQVPYLNAPPALVERWRERLGPRSVRRIGLVWSGNPRHGNDARRSIPLAAFEALIGATPAANVCWFSAQKEIRPADLPALERLGLRHHGDELEDFCDTAALMSNLDLVVSVDTSAAHLAGALGLPVWILVPHAPDWRWQLERRDSPWYPSARLFRQRDAREDWGVVLERVRQALDELPAPQVRDDSTP